MSEMSPLHAFVDEKFRETFGEPTHTLGKDQHWALHHEPGAIPINVLVNGGLELPSLWIFDTYNGDDGVVKTRLNTEAEVITIMNDIHKRLQEASLKPRRGGPALNSQRSARQRLTRNSYWSSRGPTT